MVAIGLHVNWSVLDVCVSKCEPIFVVCVAGGGGRRQDIYETHACYHVAKRHKLVIEA